MNATEYWKECISIAAEECGLVITEDQLTALSESVENGHDNYGMAFYSPPPSDRISEIDREHKQEIARLKDQHEKYRVNAETAIKQALHQREDESVSIEEHGEVLRYGGRITKIQ